MTDIARELEGARQKLLDLTLRNRLLHYRPSDLRSIRVVGEMPAEIYDALVLREKTMEFRASKARADYETWSSRAGHELEAQHTDRFLQTPYDDAALSKKLFRVYHEARSALEEQGYTVSHLALGFLEWFESEESDQPRRAPLLLIPAELERVRAGDFSRVKWTGEDVFANISLQAKLVEHGVALPPFEPPEEKGGIDAWLQQVVGAIARKRRWRVLSELTLDFFSFTKFVMFKDLDPATWPADRKPADHPLLRTLFAPSGEEKPRGFDANEIDEKLTARDLWHVMDADPSQIAVIEDVKAGRNLVVQGPPGTGKSQTITNVIAEALAAQKSVLFVSEKMAALDVVKSRLDAAGLGPFCLELHSRKANKKAVLQELQRSLGSRPAASPHEEILEEHELLKRDLNRYAFALGEPAGAYGRTPYQLFGMRQAALAQLGTSPADLPRIANAAAVREADVVTAETALRELAYIVPLVHPAAEHPWRASARESMLPHEEEELLASLAQARYAVREMREASAALAECAGVRTVTRIADLASAVRAAELLVRADAPTEAALLLSNEWNAPNAQAEELVRRVEAFQRDRATLAKTFREEALEGNHASETSELATLSTRFFRFFSGRYRMLRRELAALYASEAPKVPEMCADLTRLVELQAVRDALRHTRGTSLFGARWKHDRSDCAALRAFAEWLVAFRGELLAEALTQRAVDVAKMRIDADAICAAIARARTAAAVLSERVRMTFEALRIEEGSAIETRGFDELDAMLALWEAQLPSLFHWSRFHAARIAVRATVAAPLEPLIANDRLAPEAVVPFFRVTLAESLLRVVFGERTALGQFAGDLHEKKIARFRDLDGSLVAFHRARLSRRLHAARPAISSGAAPSSEVGILLGEMHRKRGHMSIRKLLGKAGGVIQRIKPCFLMSPLSIAQFLDPRCTRFDLIVFDEASQVRPEDAIGALLRGSQLVVMGDTQQLPPTSFFDRIAGDDSETDEEESAALKDVESILHQCARSYPSKTLEWHYRSKHQSLIAVSNLLFYENGLRVYPSAIDWDDEHGLHFVHVPRGVYDRGRTGTGVNRIEAQVVAASALDHFRRWPEKSLGIGTFNIKQQQAILEEIELQLRRHPEMEPFFKADRREPYFVKNLETIQGDERDVILISLGYGRDAAGHLSHNFGPLNREGGGRRLNVLISRAREKCVVYSNFTASDLSPDATASKGVHALRSFLDFAQTRRLPLPPAVEDEDATAFEDALAAELRARGYEVAQRIGRDEARIDLAILDPERPGRYLLGVLCDGAHYHGSRVARDRDRLREQILGTLGWGTLHRVWSIDWYRDRNAVLERLINALQVPRVPRVPRSASEEIAPVVSIAEEPEELRGTEELVAPYATCTSLRIPIAGELHLVDTQLLSAAVEDVVRVEGPVHFDEVVRRIRTLWGLQRAGNRIREAIERAAAVALRRRIVMRDGEFLRVPDATIVVRRRNGDPPPRIDLIAECEIAEALRHVLRTQFATPREALIDAAARRFGIQATSAAIAARVGEVLDAELARGELVENDDVIRINSRSRGAGVSP